MNRKRKTHVRKQYKDRLFCDLFSEKENALSLYNALNGTEYTDKEELEIITLRDVVYLTMKNDCAVCFHDCINLWEQQSSYNPNMPLRGFFYFAREYEQWIEEKGLVPKLYGSTQVKIPEPKYYVLYNGEKEMPEQEVHRLSSAFSGPAEGYEWTAYMININAGHNAKLMGKCEALSGYAHFIGLIREKQKDGCGIERAVSEAMEECIEDGVLREYLRKRRQEVKDMILTEFDKDAYEAMIREEGIQDGKDQIVKVLKLLHNGLSAGEIAKQTGLSEKEILEIAKLI
ncbi:MAG: hypothetical protein Q4C63_02425 [Eubacteriales bacterium]|nr:hypothetical protein [Eubacteriales bacterium]